MACFWHTPRRMEGYAMAVRCPYARDPAGQPAGIAADGCPGTRDDAGTRSLGTSTLCSAFAGILQAQLR